MAGQIIRLICPNLLCRTILSVPAGARGKDVRCRACGAKVRIPAPAVKPAPAKGAADGKADDAAKAEKKAG
ncbi:MAG: hypothetical protein WD768_06090 [Phycisphaeraceae bacterium]